MEPENNIISQLYLPQSRCILITTEQVRKYRWNTSDPTYLTEKVWQMEHLNGKKMLICNIISSFCCSRMALGQGRFGSSEDLDRNDN
jgi:hypothetical protein